MAARDSGRSGGAGGASAQPEQSTTANGGTERGEVEGGASDLSPELEERLDEVLAGPAAGDEGGGGHQLEDWPVPKPEDVKVADPYQSYHHLPGDEPAQDEGRRP